MLGNCGEEMVLISPTTNSEWPQIDEKILMPSTMEKPQSHPPQQAALKCPRCDSSNTKFCYYNNYSLSQPRHFCKACKRYWTRGGTLRNVPVGGGCRKNKRVKRSSSAVDVTNSVSSSTTPPPNPNNPPCSQPLFDAPNHINPLFYGLPTNPSDMNLPFQGRFSSKFSSASVSGFDLQPQLLGFSSGITSTTSEANVAVTSSSLLSNYSLFGSTSPCLASLLGSSLHQQQKYNIKDTSPPNHQFHQNLTPFEDLHVATESSADGISMKEVKIEQEQQNSRLEWNQIEQIVGFPSLDPSLYWNPNTSTGVGGWHDPGNIGSSLTSLI